MHNRFCHSRENGNPGIANGKIWIPASAEILKRYIILHLETRISNTQVKVLGIFVITNLFAPLL
jgi:hypothetical protein